MIDHQSLLIWRKYVPWVSPAQVEQDLIISRALVDIYNNPYLKNELAFRGGTALQKCFFKLPTRYSEDLDFVQINKGVIGPISNALHDTLNPWLGQPKVKRWAERLTFIYRFTSTEQKIPMRLKIEINTKENKNFLSFKEKLFTVESDWYSGEANIKTYQIDEIMGSKLRALFQRKKGRDLFDMARAIESKFINTESLLQCFNFYSNNDGKQISRSEFEKNLISKRDSESFRQDIIPLLPVNTNYDFDRDFELVMDQIITKLPGKQWKGLEVSV